MKLSARWLFPTAFWCLLLSGAAGLIYQVAWARYLALLLGHTSYAVVAVLVAFMGGLALGNAWLGRYADRLERPLALYGWLEMGIAAYGLCFPLYFDGCERGYLALARGAAPGSAWLLALKFLFSFAAILLPTTLMGGTLPVLTRLVTRRLGELRARVGGLYFVNSLGAVAGVIIADFWWLPAYGLEAAVRGAAALNAVVGLVALVVNGGLPDELDSVAGRGAEGTAKSGEGDAEAFSAFELRLAVVAAGVSGFVAMLYEVVWTRLLGLALGSSTHAFSIMLVTFIAGIAAGAWWVARWRGLRRTFDAFGWAELALAVTLLVTMFGYHLLPFVFNELGRTVARAAENYGIYQGLQFLVCFGVMFVPAMCLGMTLPLVSRVATSEVARTGRSVGLVFSVNTLGTVLGAALTGLWLMPALGLARTFALGVGLNLAIALLVLLRRSAAARGYALVGAPVVILALVTVAHGFLEPTWNRAFALGLWRQRQPPDTLPKYLDQVRRFDLQYHRDGAGSTVVVEGWRSTASGPLEYALRVNGKTDATSRGDLPTQLLVGHIPMLLHPGPSQVLVVGIGSGMTVGAVLNHPEVQHVDTIEISPEVREVARTFFGEHNQRALEDARVRVVMDDAKSFLRTAGGHYDVIISEPSNPWMAGVAGVFSLEYYEACRAALNPGGLIAQWVQVYETDDQTLKTVLATFRAVFPFLSVWQTLPGDLVLVGGMQPLPADLETFERRFGEPAVTQDLRRAEIYSLPVFLGLEQVSQFNGAFLVPPDVQVHSDYFPVLEYLAERAFFVLGGAHYLDDFEETLLRRPTTLLGEYLRHHEWTSTDSQAMALFFNTYQMPRPRLVRSMTERWQELAPDSLLEAQFSSDLPYPLPVAELEASRMAPLRDRMLSGEGDELEVLRLYARNLVAAYRGVRSVFYQPPTDELRLVLNRLVEVDEQHRLTHQLRLAEIAWDLGDDEQMFELARAVFAVPPRSAREDRFALDPSAPGRVLFRVIDTHWRAGRLNEARVWSDAARHGGFLDPERQRLFQPRLAGVVRKVEATTGGGMSSATMPPEATDLR